MKRAGKNLGINALMRDAHADAVLLSRKAENLAKMSLSCLPEESAMRHLMLGYISDVMELVTGVPMQYTGDQEEDLKRFNAAYSKLHKESE